MSTQRKRNRFLSASPSQQCPTHVSHREALEAHGLIWRTLPSSLLQLISPFFTSCESGYRFRFLGEHQPGAERRHRTGQNCWHQRIRVS
jgi:hypothetical protein